MIAAENVHEAIGRHPIRRISQRRRHIGGAPARGAIDAALEHVAASGAERVRDAPVGPATPKRKAQRRVGRNSVIEAAGITVVAHAGIMAADLLRIAADSGAAAIARGPDVPGAGGTGAPRPRRGLLWHP